MSEFNVMVWGVWDRKGGGRGRGRRMEEVQVVPAPGAIHGQCRRQDLYFLHAAGFREGLSVINTQTIWGGWRLRYPTHVRETETQSFQGLYLCNH